MASGWPIAKPMKKFLFFVLVTVALALSGCADKTPSADLCGDECPEYGFWGGVWHGMIAPFDFFGSLVWEDVTVFAQSNTGHWYDFGFLLGVGAFSSGITIGSKTKRRKR